MVDYEEVEFEDEDIPYLYGKINADVKANDYKGINTDTTTIDVDNENNTIKVETKDTPRVLTNESADPTQIGDMKIVDGIIDIAVSNEGELEWQQITAEGNQEISTLNSYNVSRKATAQISEQERDKIIPDNIAEGVTILGVQGTHTGGDQPTLYPPVITGGYNILYWESDPRNGSFASSTTGEIDGEPVTSPLAITQELDGKYLTLTSSGDKFIDASTDVLLYYMTAQSSLLSISDGGDAKQYGIAFEVSDTSLLMPQGYESYSEDIYYSPKLTTDSEGFASDSIAFSLAALSNIHPSTLKLLVVDGNNEIAYGNFSITIMKNGTSAHIASITSDYCEFSIPSSIPWDSGDDIEVIINASVFAIQYPAKGSLIYMDLNGDGNNEEYRVISGQGGPLGNVVQVVTMDPVQVGPFRSSGTSAVYALSTIDTYLNSTYYNSLTSTAKEAIIDSTFTQSKWGSDTSGNPTYTGYAGITNPGTTSYKLSYYGSFGDQLTRHVYAPSIQDIINYVTDTNITDGKIQNYNIWQLFWKTSNRPSSNSTIMLQDARNQDSPTWSFTVTSNTSMISYTSVSSSNTGEYRAVFQIDLSKVDFSENV